jgi:chromosome segregation ATPase
MWNNKGTELAEIKALLQARDSEAERQRKEIKDLSDDKTKLLQKIEEMQNATDKKIADAKDDVRRQESYTISNLENEKKKLQLELDNVSTKIKMELSTELNKITTLQVEIEKLAAENAALKLVGESEYLAKLSKVQAEHKEYQITNESLIKDLKNNLTKAQLDAANAEEREKNTIERYRSEIQTLTNSRDTMFSQVQESNEKLQAIILKNTTK